MTVLKQLEQHGVVRSASDGGDVFGDVVEGRGERDLNIKCPI